MTDINYKELGKQIKELRQAKGLSQLQLAYESDTSLDTVRIIEGAKRPDIKINTLNKICNTLGIKLSVLLGKLDI